MPACPYSQIGAELSPEDSAALFAVISRRRRVRTATDGSPYAEVGQIRWRSGEVSRPVTWRQAGDPR